MSEHDISAKAAGHSKETKARYYKKVSYEKAQEWYAKHHPALCRAVVKRSRFIVLFSFDFNARNCPKNLASLFSKCRHQLYLYELIGKN
ncbi:MAG: hypothetical protein O8C61_02455 [Candidatus Methanoperedens sp.]|nr:hypothetical protein [Candidatus Methanoperedens sp.]